MNDERWNHKLALWAGLTALFGNLAVISVVDLIGDANDKHVQALAALITSFIVGGGVYAKQRYDDERARRDWIAKQ